MSDNQHSIRIWRKKAKQFEDYTPKPASQKDLLRNEDPEKPHNTAGSHNSLYSSPTSRSSTYTVHGGATYTDKENASNGKRIQNVTGGHKIARQIEDQNLNTCVNLSKMERSKIVTLKYGGAQFRLNDQSDKRFRGLTSTPSKHLDLLGKAPPIDKLNEHDYNDLSNMIDSTMIEQDSVRLSEDDEFNATPVRGGAFATAEMERSPMVEKRTNTSNQNARSKPTFDGALSTAEPRKGDRLHIATAYGSLPKSTVAYQSWRNGIQPWLLQHTDQFRRYEKAYADIETERKEALQKQT